MYFNANASSSLKLSSFVHFSIFRAFSETWYLCPFKSRHMSLFGSAFRPFFFPVDRSNVPNPPLPPRRPFLRNNWYVWFSSNLILLTLLLLLFVVFVTSDDDVAILVLLFVEVSRCVPFPPFRSKSSSLCSSLKSFSRARNDCFSLGIPSRFSTMIFNLSDSSSASSSSSSEESEERFIW